LVETTGSSFSQGFLFDTNVIIAALREEESVTRRLAKLPSDSLFIPAIALGELYFGALKSARPAENLARFQQFATNSNVLSCNEVTAHRYGSTRDALRRIGRPIPENDLWISAIALQKV
jgi:tRNA(fMet)-specific endonuclease VapC